MSNKFHNSYKKIIAKKISSNLKKLLKHHSISYRQIGSRIGSPHVHIAKIVYGDYSSPGILVLKKIADFFRISVSQLIGDQEIDFKNRPKDLTLSFDE